MVDEESLTGLLLSELYLNQKTTPVYDNGCSHDTEVPFRLLPGEFSKYISLHDEGSQFIVLTSYRLFATSQEGYCSVPLGLIEGVEYYQSNEIGLLCKDGRVIKLHLDNSEQCRLWYHRVMESIKLPSNFRDIFAFIHYAYMTDAVNSSSSSTHNQLKKGNLSSTTSTTTTATESFTSEYFRMSLNLTGTWRITECNTKYSLCSSYPKLFIVPQSITDDQLQQVAKFRSMGRVPAVTYRHKNGCVLVRSSQPMVGVLGWRCQEDELFLQALSKSCSDHTQAPPMEIMLHRGEDKVGGVDHDENHTPLLLIVDLRSYTAVLGNRAKGGGGEHQDYYSNCEVVYKGLPNIHSVRSSFCSLRNLIAGTEQNRFLSQVEATHWLQYVSQLLQTAVEISSVINDTSRPVLVHCSDGWDRTTQVVTLTQLLLDPHYRTLKGFGLLIEREWLSFGHKFADRCGFGAEGEQSPIFLQWLDCVYQLVVQYPCAFQFTVLHLVKLAQHCYSQLYGTFLGNCEQERERELVTLQTLSVWSDLLKKETANVLYKENSIEILRPSPHVRYMKLWDELYLQSNFISYTLSFQPRPPITTPPDTPTQIRHSLPNTSNDHTSLVTNSHTSNGHVSLSHTSNGHASLDHTPNGHTSLEANGHAPNIVNGLVTNGHASFFAGENREEESDESNIEEEEKEVEKEKDPEEEKEEGREKEGDIQPVYDMEESFRVVTDTSEYSLTTLAHHSSVEPHPLDTPTFSNQLSVSLNYSTFSECEGRLRLLGNDGLAKLVDPVQERVTELNELLWQRIKDLEEEVKRLSNERMIKGDGLVGVVKEEVCPILTEEKRNEASSPLNNEWAYISASDSNGVQWIPDHAVSHCKLCGAQFWLGKRKHHCRSCGGVFCWQCSNYYTPVPHEQLFTDQRVCKTCFDKLGGHFNKISKKDAT